MRNKFEEELKELNTELIAMGALCAKAISEAAAALLNDDLSRIEKVRKIDHLIDQKEREIENLCMRLLLRQQPVAKDLRVISSALKMISDMERIGDQASDIAEIVKCDRDLNGISRIHIGEMADAAIKMVKESVDAFINQDVGLAKEVMLYDDVVDRLFDRVKHEITSLIRASDMSSECGLDLLMIAKYLERIGDHAVNIAEWVEYAVSGRHKKDWLK